MSANPKPRIEDQLKAYAQQRRAQASPPFELHPATRKLLQDEVARTLSRPERSAAGSGAFAWWRMRWPGLAVAAAVGLVATFGLLHLMRPKPTELYQLARAKDESGLRGIGNPAAPPAPKRVLQSVTPDEAPRAASPRTVPETEFVPVPSDAAPAISPSEPAPVSDKLARGEGPETKSRPAPALVSATATERSQKTASESLPSPGKAAGTGSAALMRQRYGLAGAGTRPVTAAPERQPLVAPATQGRVSVPEAQRDLPTSSGNQVGQSSPAPGGFGGGPEPASSALREDLLSAAAPASAPYGQPGSADTRRQVGLEQARTAFAMKSAGPPDAGQQFARINRYRRNFNSPARTAVLESFNLRQDQANLIFRDADDSVYIGSLESDRGVALRVASQSEGVSHATEAGRSPATQNADGNELVKVAAQQGFPFRVSGTNRTLNQLVVFEGRLMPSMNGAASNRPLVTSPNVATNGIDGARVTQGMRLSRVTGRVTVGDGVQFELDALPVRP